MTAILISCHIVFAFIGESKILSLCSVSKMYPSTLHRMMTHNSILQILPFLVITNFPEWFHVAPPQKSSQCYSHSNSIHPVLGFLLKDFPSIRNMILKGLSLINALQVIHFNLSIIPKKTLSCHGIKVLLLTYAMCITSTNKRFQATNV